MKIALLGGSGLQFGKVYTPDVLEKLGEYGELSARLGRRDLETNAAFLRDCEIAFSTWGMPALTGEEIARYLPNLKAVFYAAGTVQYFARPFLERGVRVFNASAANAVPVAEYAFAQISLAAKGYFQAAKFYRSLPLYSLIHANAAPGLYGCRVGLVGLGAVGQAVAEKLKALDVEVYACDPFVSAERAEALNVTLTDMETLFRTCDVVSNHLADKEELKNVFGRRLFRLMKPRAVFINTGRGAQVSEYALAASLLTHPSRTFVGDVMKREIFPYINPLFWCPNAVLTPHIAGSTGQEPRRMGYLMIGELDRYLKNEPARCEVTLPALEHMA
ncbi:MAG: hydroxyacid dehydrogenase [Clostridia bacterium]|nr:hydroxyacid dehydrogenase [Clostridia bacterium]